MKNLLNQPSVKLLTINIFKISFIANSFIFFLWIFIGILYGNNIDQTHEFINLGIKNWKEIFMNNMKVAASLLIIGVLTLSLYSFLILAINGFMVGAAATVDYFENGLAVSLKKIILHGIIELVGFLLVSAIVTSIWIYTFITIKKQKNVFNKQLIYTFFYTILISAFMIFIASLVEGYFMPILKEN